MNRQKKKYSLSVFIGVLLLVIIVIGCGIRFMDSAAFSDTGRDNTEEPATRKTITVNGKDYFPRQDITVVLAMGIDTTGEMVSSGSYNNEGEADVVALIVFDEADKTFTVLNLNRDTMVEMPVLGIGGRKAGTAVQQLALAHTYGSGMEDSCENTRETVSALINNVYIDYYIAANMDAIAIGNDAVGGVTVNVTDDFSMVDENLPTGQVKLMGQQAVSFIRMRKNVGDQLNLSRMERHKEYIGGFMDSLKAKLESGDSFIYKLYEDISPYMVSDMSATVLSSLASRYEVFTLKEIVSPEGENIRGEKYMEFHIDDKAFSEIVLKLFYREKAAY